jgi:putative ABC transport system substrate-binding protein
VVGCDLRHEGESVRRREFIAVVGAAATWPLTARAQQSDKMRLIGVLLAAVERDTAGQARLAAFRSALGKFGWTEGSNLRIEVRWSTDPEVAARHAAELVVLGAEVLVGEANTHQALRRQTHTIPIVFVSVTDPSGQGLVASLFTPRRRHHRFQHIRRANGGQMVGDVDTNHSARDARRGFI